MQLVNALNNVINVLNEDNLPYSDKKQFNIR